MGSCRGPPVRERLRKNDPMAVGIARGDQPPSAASSDDRGRKLGKHPDLGSAQGRGAPPPLEELRASQRSALPQSLKPLAERGVRDPERTSQLGPGVPQAGQEQGRVKGGRQQRHWRALVLGDALAGRHLCFARIQQLSGPAAGRAAGNERRVPARGALYRMANRSLSRGRPRLSAATIRSWARSSASARTRACRRDAATSARRTSLIAATPPFYPDPSAAAISRWGAGKLILEKRRETPRREQLREHERRELLDAAVRVER